MNAAEALAACDAEVRRLEGEMLATEDPAHFEKLKAKLHHARWYREVAEQQRAAEAAQSERRHETPDELWRAWCDVRFLSRGGMSARLKSRLIQRFGRRNYERLPP
jgi:hypothetical protein